MKRRTAACPSCAAPIEFKVGTSLVTVCEFCQSAIARVDRKVEDHGKVADLIETNSPLRRGLTGKFGRKQFSIFGRVQYAHPAGGTWNEWYLAFPGGKWGWLAESQGKLYLMFQRQLSSSIRLPDYEALEVGKVVRLGKSEFTVTEKGSATAATAEGDIPWNFRPGAKHVFADLSGPDGTFATFEYGDRPAAYVGKEVSLESLQLDGLAQVYEESKIIVPAVQLNCPQCAGPLLLHAPDSTERVTCQNCNSMLDASNGKLEYFATLKNQEKLPILILLGSQGTLFGDDYLVIGFLRRFALYEGSTYPWSEYLLYNQNIGYRWLIHNDGHWAFAEPAPGHLTRSGNSVQYDGDNFAVYDRGTAYVRSVMGEFYWRVEVGETVRTSDYIAPPRMLSFEWSETGDSEEMNVTLGTYLLHEDVEQAFGVTDLRRPWSVGVIQPRPDVGFGVFGLWLVFIALIVVIHVAFSKPGSTVGSDPWMMFYAILFVSLIPVGILAYFYSFEAKRWQDSDYSPYASE